MNHKLILMIFLLLVSQCSTKEDIRKKSKSITSNMGLPFNPRSYVVYKISEAISIDGKVDEEIWKKADWTKDFIEREESTRPTPEFRTRVKMLWDEKYFYFAGELEETDIWATMRNRDEPLYQENAFEVFIDPTRDTHNYFEFEINPLGTIYDLFFTRSGGNGSYGISNWNLLEPKSEVFIEGTINNPKDKDNKWTVEIALPFEVLNEVVPNSNHPRNGDQWRVNFLRMNWAFEIVKGRYRKKIADKTNRPVGEYKWTWSPQKRSMHIPETWGYVQFSDTIDGQGKDKFIWNRNEKIKWALRQIYYQEKKFREDNGYFTDDISELNVEIDPDFMDRYEPKIQTTMTLFEASATGYNDQTKWYINSMGRIWSK